MFWSPLLMITPVYNYVDEITWMLFPTSHSPQRPTQSSYSGNGEAKQQLQHQRLLGASTQWDAERHHPGVQGKHTSAESCHMCDMQAMSLCLSWRQQAPKHIGKKHSCYSTQGASFHTNLALHVQNVKNAKNSLIKFVLIRNKKAVGYWRILESHKRLHFSL